MTKNWIWIVIGIVIVAGVAYGAYWLGGKNTLTNFADYLNSNANKSAAMRAQGTCYSTGGINGGHVVCWSANELRIITVDGGCPHSGC